MNKLFITLITFSVILVFFYFGGIVSFYKAANTNVNFNGADALIAFDSNGNLKTVPVSNVNTGVDAAISRTADLLNTDITKNANNYNNFSANVLPTLANKQEVASSVQQGTQSLPTFDSLGSYVKKGSPVSIQVGEGSSGYTYSSSNPRYLYGSGDNWRVAYSNKAPDAKFILN
jgi:hypothetical protein